MDFDPIVKAQLDPIFTEAAHGDDKALQNLENLAKNGGDGFKSYIAYEAGNGNDIAKEIIDNLLADAVNVASGNTPAAVVPKAAQKPKGIKPKMKNIQFSDKSTPISNLKFDWGNGEGDEDVFMIIHVPSDNVRLNSNGKHHRISKVTFFGSDYMQPMKARIGGYKEADGSSISDDGDGNEVFLPGEYDLKVSKFETEKAPQLNNFRKLCVRHSKPENNGGFLIKNLGDEDEERRVVGKLIVTVGRAGKGGKTYPYPVESINGDDALDTGMRLETVDGEIFHLLKWNFEGIAGSINHV